MTKKDVKSRWEILTGDRSRNFSNERDRKRDKRNIQIKILKLGKICVG